MPVVRPQHPVIALAYEPEARRLTVTFPESGETRTFERVPRTVYEAFERAPSKGQFFATHIRDRYRSA